MKIRRLEYAQAQALGQLLRWPARCAALEPNCTDGYSLLGLVGDHGAKYVVVESKVLLGSVRSAKRTICGSLFPRAIDSIHVKEKAFSVLLLNVSVDEEDETRALDWDFALERLYLRHSTKYLMPGGVLVFVFNLRRFKLTEARMVAAEFSDWQLFKLVDGRLALLAKKRPEPVLDLTGGSDLLNRTRSFVPPPGMVPVIDVPESDPEVVPFRGGMATPEDAMGLSLASPLWEAAKAATAPVSSIMTVRPPLAMHSEHIGLLATCGCLDQLPVGTGDAAHILKGTAVKTHDESEGYDEEGNEQTTSLERFSFKCRALTRDGKIVDLVGDESEAGEDE